MLPPFLTTSAASKFPPVGQTLDQGFSFTGCLQDPKEYLDLLQVKPVGLATPLGNPWVRLRVWEVSCLVITKIAKQTRLCVFGHV